jgi:hypothetical protein
MSVLHKIRAWFRRRTEGSTDASNIDSDRQSALSTSGIATRADAPVNYVPPADEGRPRH